MEVLVAATGVETSSAVEGMTLEEIATPAVDQALVDQEDTAPVVTEALREDIAPAVTEAVLEALQEDTAPVATEVALEDQEDTAPVAMEVALEVLWEDTAQEATGVVSEATVTVAPHHLVRDPTEAAAGMVAVSEDREGTALDYLWD